MRPTLTAGTFTDGARPEFRSPGDACSATQNVATERQLRELPTGHQLDDRRPHDPQRPELLDPLDRRRHRAAATTGSRSTTSASASTTSAISISPTATGSASPNPAGPGQPTTLSGTITPGQNPTSASLRGGLQSDVDWRIGDAVVDRSRARPSASTPRSTRATPPNTYTLPCSVTDDQSRSTSFNISLTVLIPLNSTCGAAATPIHAVQGSGATSPLVGQTVDLEGIVVGAFQGSGALNGFYLEEPPATQDGDPLTSEGIFVFANSPAVNAGDRVRIRGTVAEFASATGSLVSNLTELGSTSNATVCSTGNPLPPPATISLPVDNVVGLRTLRRDAGAVHPAARGHRHLQPGHVRPNRSGAERSLSAHAEPGPIDLAATASLNSRSVISLDDASTSSNANLNGGGLAPYPPPGLSATNTLRVGALVNPNGATPAPLVGVLDDRFGSYRIQPTVAGDLLERAESAARTSRTAVDALRWTVPRGQRQRAELLHDARQPRRATAQELTDQRDQSDRRAQQVERRCLRPERSAEFREWQHQRRHLHQRRGQRS